MILRHPHAGLKLDPPHEIALGLPNDRHAWWYYPDLQPDELIAIRTYDSHPSFVPTLHTAFDDPSTPQGYCPRESVEARVLCVLPNVGSAKL